MKESWKLRLGFGEAAFSPQRITEPSPPLSPDLNGSRRTTRADRARDQTMGDSTGGRQGSRSPPLG